MGDPQSSPWVYISMLIHDDWMILGYHPDETETSTEWTSFGPLNHRFFTGAQAWPNFVASLVHELWPAPSLLFSFCWLIFPFLELDAWISIFPGILMVKSQCLSLFIYFHGTWCLNPTPMDAMI